MLYTFYKNYGSVIHMKYIKDGKSYKKTIKEYKPTLYLKSNKPNTELVSIEGDSLETINFKSIREAKDFTKNYEDVDSLDLVGNSDYGHQFITELYDGKTPQFNADDLHFGFIDIEVYTKAGFPHPKDANDPINAVSIYSSKNNTYYLISDKDYIHDKNSDVGHLKVEFYKVDGEYNLILKMLDIIEECNFDIFSGWNSEGFDLPYIVNRGNKIVGEDIVTSKLSPFNSMYMRTGRDDFGNDQLKVSAMGLQHCDYMLLYKKHIKTPRESYKLDFIASEEIGSNKLTFEEEGSLTNLYDTNPQKFLEYNLRDVELLVKLEEKLKLFQVTYALAYTSFSNFEDTISSVKQIENLIAVFLYNKGQVPNFKRESVDKTHLEGAYVKETEVGLHDWIVTFDLNSLYPHLIMQANIGQETLIDIKDLRRRIDAECKRRCLI